MMCGTVEKGKKNSRRSLPAEWTHGKMIVLLLMHGELFCKIIEKNRTGEKNRICARHRIVHYLFGWLRSVFPLCLGVKGRSFCKTDAAEAGRAEKLQMFHVKHFSVVDKNENPR